VLTSLLDNFFSTKNVVNSQFKILVIRNFEELTKPAQFSLRRRIETSCQSVRFVFISKSYNHIEPALISRCLLLKCPKPTDLEIETRIRYICKNKIDVDQEMISKSIQLSEKNVGRALFYLTAMYECGSSDMINPTTVALYPLITCLKSKQYDCVGIRKVLSDLQLAHISHTKIIWYLIDNVEPMLPNSRDIFQIVIYAADCEAIAAKGKRSVIALEKFILHLYQLIHGHL
jgi:replication factor C subunit 3/5